MRTLFTWLLLFLSLPHASEAFADTTCNEPEAASDDCVSIGKLHLGLGLGIGTRSNPVDTMRDIPLVAVPQFSYYGKRFFLDNLDLGFTFYESDTHTFNLVATPGYDRVFFYQRDLQNFFVGGVGGGGGPTSASTGVTPPPAQPPQKTDSERILERRRHVTYHLGPEWHYNVGRITGQLDALYEITGEHDGTEIRAAVAMPLFASHGTLTASVGATWKSGALVTYFYGEKGIYEGGSAFNPFVKLSYGVPLTKRWSIKALAHVEWLDHSITDSPIIFESYVTTIFAGVFYSY